MKHIDSHQLENITGGRAGRSSTTMQTALTGITSALDSLKQNQDTGNGSLQQLLPFVMMAKWIQNR